MFSRLITSPPRVGGSGLRGSPLSLQHLDHVFRALADDPEEDPQPGDEQDQVDQAKRPSVVQTSPAETTGETPSLVRSRPWTIHGCRPTSVATQPMLMAMSGSGKHTTSSHSSQRAFSRRLRTCMMSASSITPMNRNDRAIIRW